MLAAFYVEGYLSFSLPAVLIGFIVPMVGLTVAAYAYGATVILMALASMIAVIFLKRIRPSGICVFASSQEKNCRSSGPTVDLGNCVRDTIEWRRRPGKRRRPCQAAVFERCAVEIGT